MADTVSMSLDEYIKTKKIRRPGNPNRKPVARSKTKTARALGASLKTKRLKRNARLRVPAKAALRGLRRGRGLGVKRNNNQRRTLVFRRSGFGYFDNQNAEPKSYNTGSIGRRPRGGRGRGRGGGRLSMAARRQLLQQQLQPGASTSRSTRTRKRLRGGVKKQGVLGGNKAKSRLVVVAQQRLKKARAVLAARRRVLGGTRAATSTVSGRIRFSQYGLLTTQRRNVQENRISIQEKIQRAQIARQQVRQHLVPALQSSVRPFQPVRSRPSAAVYSPPRRAYRGSTVSTVDFTLPSFYSGGSLYSDRVAPLRSRQVDNDTWVHPQRRITNLSYGTTERYSRQSSIMSDRFQQEEPREPYLDPEIQDRISHIQQAGRRRREEPDRCLVVPDYRGPVCSSRMMLGERFKRLQR